MLVMLVMSETHRLPVFHAVDVVDPYSPVPLYRQIADLIMSMIKSGEYAPGDQLPSESRLSQEYGVSRLTARSAYRYLREQGAVVTAQGRGSFVPPTSEPSG